MGSKFCDCKATTHHYIRTIVVGSVTKVCNYIGCSECGLPTNGDKKSCREEPNGRPEVKEPRPEHSILSKLSSASKREREFCGLGDFWDDGNEGIKGYGS
jgi:hypothetical protein